MPFNGSGTFTRSYSWASDATNGVLVRSDRMDTEDNNFATGLSTVICKDGQTTTTAAIPFAVGVELNDGTVSTPALSFISELSSGLFRPSSGNVTMTVLGINTAQFSSNNMTAGTHYTVSSATPLLHAGTSTGYFQHSLQNLSNGATASTDVVCTADTGTDTTNYVNLGINSSGFSGTGFSNALDGYLYAQSNNLAVGTVAAKDLIILTNNTEVGRFTSAGNLALTGNAGITVNTNKFTVDGATGNTVIAGTLGVTGNTTISGTLGVTGLITGTTTTQTAGDRSTNLATTAYVDTNAIGGSGQAWKDVTGSRGLTTVYTNSTGRPIMVTAVVSLTNPGSSATLTIDSIANSGCAPFLTSGATGAHPLTGIVPNGKTYQVTTSGTGSILSWLELC